MRLLQLLGVTKQEEDICIEKGQPINLKGIGCEIETTGDLKKGPIEMFHPDEDANLLILSEDVGPSFEHYPLVTILREEHSFVGLLRATTSTI